MFIIIVIKDHQTLKKSQTFPFLYSSTSILCSIKANNHIFPATFIPCFSTPPKPNMLDGPGRGRAKSTEANWVQKEAGGSMHRHNPVICYKKPLFPIFLLGNFCLEKMVFVEFVNSLLDVNFLLIMMSNVTCLCKKLQIWDMGFCHCWISLRNIVKDLQKTQVEYCWIRPKLSFWCYFLFLQLEALFLSLKLSDLMPTVLMHGSAGKVSTTIEGKQRIWWYEKK